MIDYYKDILGIAAGTEDFDVYLVIICAITLSWVLKMVICGVYNAVLHIFF